MAEAPPEVRLAGVSVSFGDRDARVDALGPVDLDVARGEFLCVVGPSGCGKTTLLQLVAGFLTASAGSVEVGGRRVDGPAPERGVVFQQANLYPWLTVRGNVEFGPRMRGVRRADRARIATEQLELVGLADAAGLRPYELSGGMQQRCQIARVLANDPELLLMDEPFGALDAITRERLQNELLRIRARDGRTVVFITHSVDEAAYLASRVVVLSPRPGRIVLDVPGPFAGRDDRPDGARSSAEFVEFRRLVRSRIGDGRAAV